MKRVLSLVLFLMVVLVGCKGQRVEQDIIVEDDGAVVEKCVVRLIPDVEVDISGDYEQFVGKEADYTITVTNTGAKVLEDVKVEYLIPENIDVVEGDVVGYIAELKHKESQSFDLVLKAKKPGKYTNVVKVSISEEELEKHDEFVTIWKEQTALSLDMIDSSDPLMVEEMVSYEVVVTNLKDQNDSAIRLEVFFPEEILLLETKGAGEHKIAGNVAVFKFNDILKAKDSYYCHVKAKVKKTGEGVVKAKFTSRLVITPVVVEEDVHIF
jgi:uncharacterized repeat protein (TIGR01451 family)